MYASPSYHNTMSLLTKSQSKTNEQHQDHGKSHFQRDCNDLQNLTNLQASDAGLFVEKSITTDSILKILEGSSKKAWIMKQ